MALYDEMGEEGLGSDEEVTLPEQTVTTPTNQDWYGYADLTKEELQKQYEGQIDPFSGKPVKFNPGDLVEYDKFIKSGGTFKDLINFGKKLLGGKGSLEDYMSLLPFAAGFLGANKSSDPTILNPGYQGGIPRVTATRTMLTEPPAGRRPGSGGINYGGDVTYARTGENLSAENAGISTPVSQPLGGTPTHTQPAAYDLASLQALIQQLQQFQNQNRPATPGAPSPTPGAPTPGAPSQTPGAPTPAPSAASAGPSFVAGPGSQQFGGFRSQAEYDAAVAQNRADQQAYLQELINYQPSAPFLASYFANPETIPRQHGESIDRAILRLKSQDKEWADRQARRAAISAGEAPTVYGDTAISKSPVGLSWLPSDWTQSTTTPTPGPSQVIADETGFTPSRDYGFTPTPGPSQVIADETGFTPSRDYASSTAQPINDLQGLFQQVYGRAGTDAEVQNLAGKSTDEARGILESSIASWRASQQQPMHTANPNQSLIEAARGGLLPNGFVIPADVVSHLGNGSSEAGLDYLAEYLGAKPIKGTGDGMSDSIPTTIGGKQPARVANEEAFVPPEVVKRLGNGDTERGAKKLYAMMDRIRKARTGTTEQGKEINPERFMPGGKVNRYQTGGVTSSSLAEWVGPYVTNMLGQGQALAQSPYQAYTGPLTAGVSPLQQQAFGIAAGLQTPQAISQAAQTAGGLASAFGNVNYTPTTFGSQFQAPETYKPTEFQTEMFGAEQAQQYMNPYIQQALDPQLREARRQAEISRNAEAARMSKAGAFGGSRQAIMESEGTRNLLDRVSDITGTGYSTAYDKAQQAFAQDQARRLQAQQLSEGSRQFGASQGMTAADLAARYGLAGQQATEASRQFGANLGLQGLQGALEAARTQGQLGNLQSAADINNLRALAELGGVQRGIEAEGIAADKAQFEEARANPYKMLQFQQSLLSGLPLASQSLVMPGQSNLQQFAGGASTAAQMLSYFFPDLFKSQNPAASTTAPKAP